MSQNLNETISYINTLLKASTYNLVVPEFPSKYDYIYDAIHVDEHGKIEGVRFLIEKQSGKETNGVMFYAYLKSLQIGHKKDYSDYYSMSLDCAGFQLCFGGIGVDRTDVTFQVTTASNRDKLYNAFSHLLDLAKNNKDFYEKDPFGN
jgi:hypothetical protein